MTHLTQDSFIPNEGVTAAEKYLSHLCKKTFLSLWSYPGLFKESGKELCDLLVIFDDDIIIFSDKYCLFPNSGNLSKDWSKWFRRAIEKSAYQAWGAERWIKQNPDKIFLDRKALNSLPFSLPNPSATKFHIIVVAHDGAKRCARELGGSGSFTLQSDLINIQNHIKPFIIGDLNPTKTFVHVLDDVSLNILLNKLDTISDFVSYLNKKEGLFRSKLKIFAAGEEELLASYLTKINDEGVHDFIFPKNSDGIGLLEGIWEGFINNPQVEKQRKSDQISYAWDKLIEKFNYHTLTGTQYRVVPSGIQTSEKVLRLMAKETRLSRRMLAKSIINLLEKTPANSQGTRYLGSKDPKDKRTTYVFLLLPRIKTLSDKEYRDRRGLALEAYCHIAKLRFPHAQNIVGIATESGIDNDSRSEDAIYFDASQWTQEQQKNAEKLFSDMGLKKDLDMNYFHENEYPDIPTNDPTKLTTKPSKNPRNKPCPCGSHKKYKFCHGK